MRFIIFFINVSIFLSTLVILLLSVCAAADEMEVLDKQPIPIDFNDVVVDDRQLSTEANRSVIRIAVAAMISPKFTYQFYVQLLNRIGNEMGRRVSFIQKKSYAEVNQMLKQRELDLAFVCSGPYVSGKKDFGMEIIAVPVCHGETVYYSYFIASRKSRIDSFDDLKGKTFAFTDPLSNTGYMVPTYYLARRNQTSESYFAKTFFTHSHDNSIQAVADDIADGAAVDSLIFEFMQTKNPKITKKIRIIEKSKPYGIPPIVVHPSMSPSMKKKLKNIFLSIHKSRQGKAILRKLNIDRFVEGNDDAYDSVRSLQTFLKSKQP